MSEESGVVVLKVTDEVHSRIEEGKNSDIKDIVREIAEIAGLEPSKFESVDCRIDDVVSAEGYVSFTFDCSDWERVSRALVSNGNSIEVYSRISDEYGTNLFYSLNENGERFGYSFDEEGDECDQDGFEEKLESELNNWLKMIPERVKENFPKLSGRAKEIIEEYSSE